MVEGVIDPDALSSRAAEYEAILSPIIEQILNNNIDTAMGAYLILDPSKAVPTGKFQNLWKSFHLSVLYIARSLLLSYHLLQLKFYVQYSGNSHLL